MNALDDTTGACVWAGDVGVVHASGRIDMSGLPLEVRLPKDLSSSMGVSVPIFGWFRRDARWAYGSKTVSSKLIRALRAMRDAWGYVPKHLVLSISDTGKPGLKGLAYPPHRSKDGKLVRLITISPLLLEEYAPEAFFRVLLHELSHHKRFDEGHLDTSAKKSHDGRFCAILARVDAVVARRPSECRTSRDDVDPAAVRVKYGAAPQELTLRLRSRKEDGRRKKVIEVIDPNGHVVRREPLTSRSMRTLGQALTGSWSKVRVEGAGEDQRTFLSFFEARMDRYSEPVSERLRGMWQAEKRRRK